LQKGPRERVQAGLPPLLLLPLHWLPLGTVVPVGTFLPILFLLLLLAVGTFLSLQVRH
jgi:hypothetical protein